MGPIISCNLRVNQVRFDYDLTNLQGQERWREYGWDLVIG